MGYWKELRASHFRVVPANRLEQVVFEHAGMLQNARTATKRYMRMGLVLEEVGKYLAEHPGSSQRRIGDTNRLRKMIKEVLER